MSDKPRTLYSAGMHYRTPAKRKVWYTRVVAAHTLEECENILTDCLLNEQKFGRRRVYTLCGDFTATIIGDQIQTK
jgi:hypothetical protein